MSIKFLYYLASFIILTIGSAIGYIYYFYTHNVNLYCYYDQQISIEGNKANKDLINGKEYIAIYDLSKREGLIKLTEKDIDSEYFKLEIGDPYKGGYDKIIYKVDGKKTELDIIGKLNHYRVKDNSLIQYSVLDVVTKDFMVYTCHAK